MADKIPPTRNSAWLRPQPGSFNDPSLPRVRAGFLSIVCSSTEMFIQPTAIEVSIDKLVGVRSLFLDKAIAFFILAL